MVMRAYEEFRAFEKHVTERRTKGDSIFDVADDMKMIGSIYQDVEQVRRTDIAKFLERRSVMNVGAVTPLLLWLLSTNVPEAVLGKCLKGTRELSGTSGRMWLRRERLRGTVRRFDHEVGHSA